MGEIQGEKSLLLAGPFVVIFILKSVIHVNPITTFQVGGIYVGLEVLVDVAIVWLLTKFFKMPVRNIPIKSLLTRRGMSDIAVIALTLNLMACISALAFKVSA